MSIYASPELCPNTRSDGFLYPQVTAGSSSDPRFGCRLLDAAFRTAEAESSAAPLQQPRTVVGAGAIDLAANATKGLVEGVVRTVTDNDEYQFGDLTKGVVRDLTGKDASEYKFGDITKKAVTNFTGKEDYEFGDISRKVLADAESRRWRRCATNISATCRMNCRS